MRWILLLTTVLGVLATGVTGIVHRPSPWMATQGAWVALLAWLARRLF